MVIDAGWLDKNAVQMLFLLLSLSMTVSGFVLFMPAIKRREDAKEPPIIPSTIPYLDHIIGIFWYRSRYYAKLSSRYNHDIYTLPMPGSSLYIVNSPDLALAAQRLPKQLSFWVLEAKFSKAVGGLSKEGSEMLLQNAFGQKGENSLVVDGMKRTHKAMMTDAKHMNRAAVEIAASFLEELKTERKTIDLWEWVRHVMTMATSGGVYGPMNPYQDPAIEEGLQALAKDTIPLLSGVMPRVLAPKGLEGREKIVAGFKKYFSENGHESGSDLVKGRMEALRDYEISADDIARLETVNGFGILVNTIPTAFWTIYHVFSDPTILKTIREQVRSIVQVEEQEDGKISSRTIDVGRIREIPILSSILQEALRYHSTGVGARLVIQDFIFNDRYLLKKDSYLLMPNRGIHFDSRAWGPTANDFDPERFAKLNEQCPGAFRGFGGGVHLCPGRQFAMTIILATVAMFALRYDVAPVSGKWEDPLEDDSNLAMIVALPKKRVLVDVVPREGLEDGSWAFAV